MQSNTDGEISRLRRALDGAIYALEQIKRRAESGATTESADWDCLLIAEAAEAAIERIARDVAPPANDVHPSHDGKQVLRLVSSNNGRR